MPPYLGPRSGSHRMKTRFHVLILVLILFSSHTPFSFISASRTQTSSSPRKRISTPISPPLHNDILFQIHSHLHSTRDKLNLRLARYSYALESTSQTLRLRNFSSFRNAVKRGDEDAVNKFYGYWATGALNANIYRHGRLMLLAKHCDAFRQAAAKGYTKILQKLWNWASSPQGTITTPPACSPLQMNMLTSLGFQAFQRAVISPLNNISATNHNPYSSTAHLLWSWAAKCNVRDEMLSAKDYEAFHAVIAHGNTAMARLMHGIWCREVSSVIQSPSLSSTSCARMLSSRLFGASILAVTHNHPHLLSLLHTWAKSYNLNAQQLAADSFDSFVTAAELGHVRMLREWACEVDLEVQEEEGGAGGVTMANEQIEVSKSVLIN